MLSWKGWVLIRGAGGSWVGGGDGCAGVGGGGWLRNSAAAGATAASFSPGQIKMGPNAWKFQPNQNAKTSFTFDLFKKLYMIIIRQICWCPSRSFFSAIPILVQITPFLLNAVSWHSTKRSFLVSYFSYQSYLGGSAWCPNIETVPAIRPSSCFAYLGPSR